MKKIVLFSFIFIQFFVLNLYGQFHLKAGAQTGVNFNIHTGRDLYDVASGFGSVFGAQVDISFNNAFGLITNLQFYDNRSGSVNEEFYNRLPTDQGLIEVETKGKESTSLVYILFEPLLKLSVPSSRLYFVVGPGIGINIKGTIEDNFTQTLPEGHIFPETGTNKITQNTKTTLVDLFDKLEFKFGSGYDILLGNGMYLTPQINFGYGITPVQHNVSWSILTVQAMLAFKYTLIK